MINHNISNYCRLPRNVFGWPTKRCNPLLLLYGIRDSRRVVARPINYIHPLYIIYDCITQRRKETEHEKIHKHQTPMGSLRGQEKEVRSNKEAGWNVCRSRVNLIRLVNGHLGQTLKTNFQSH